LKRDPTSSARGSSGSDRLVKPPRLKNRERRRIGFDRRPGRTHELLAALFLLGVLLFAPPLLVVFNRPTLILGVPTLYFYLFAAWTALVALVAFAVERRHAADDLAEKGPESAGRESGNVTGGPSDA
jgi:hypothetical protein